MLPVASWHLWPEGVFSFPQATFSFQDLQLKMHFLQHMEGFSEANFLWD